MGIPLCPNKQDVRWCQNATSWEVPENWTPMFGRDRKVKVKCSYETDKDPRGQWINDSEKGDGLDYHCLNRKDENPFLKKANTTKTEKKSWLENVNSTCPDVITNGISFNGKHNDRRCLGNRADECVCKYNISRE